jgi:hypothetical protein
MLKWVFAGLAMVCMLTTGPRLQAHVPIKSLYLQGEVFGKGASTGLPNSGAAAVPSKAPQTDPSKQKDKNCKQTDKKYPTVRGAGPCERGGGPGGKGK